MDNDYDVPLNEQDDLCAACSWNLGLDDAVVTDDAFPHLVFCSTECLETYAESR